jgi:protein subunit release factor B
MSLLRRLFLSTSPVRNIFPPTPCAFFSTTTSLPQKPLPPRPTILESDITEAFLKGTGPGGQKINKTSSAVQLKHLPTGLVIKCQETRSRSQNRKIARRILAERIEVLVMGDDSRAALKAEREKKKKASKNKKARRKYRKLDDDNEAELDPDETPETDEVKDEREHETRDIKLQPDAVKESTAPAPHAVQSHHKP